MTGLRLRAVRVSTASIARSGAAVAAGTLASRATGFVRSVLVAAALGSALFADSYNVANTIPNIVFVLLVGGTLNAVFVPQLARAMEHDADDGRAFVDRMLTAALVALAAATAGAWLAAPLIVDAYSDFSGAQRELTVSFARYCLPQIFFYGLFTVVGQVLNARGRFGPMAWTPVLNNVVVGATFGLYLALAGTASDATQLEPAAARLLGLGTTAGIVVQALALLPALRSIGFRWRARFDWRRGGLGRLLPLSGWMVAVVVVTQIGYWLTTRLATETSVRADAQGVEYGVGYSAYGNAHLLWLLPHSVIAVSLLTVTLPRLSRSAARGALEQVHADLGNVVRATVALIVPAAVFLAALGPQIATVAFLQGQMTVADTYAIGWMLSAFGLGLIPFSVQYLLVRTFYALDDARTPFLLTVGITGLHAALSLACFAVLPPRWAMTGVAGAYGVAYLVGLVLTARVLRRRLRPPESANWTAVFAPVLWCVLPAAALLAVVETAVEAMLGPSRGAALVSVGAGLVVLPGCYLLLLRLRHPHYLRAVLAVRAPDSDGPPR
ncbi:MAG: murein biosynthesis integral membrane protein MurJ [Sporichthyaceae bacterium]